MTEILIFIANPTIALLQLLYIPMSYYPLKIIMSSVENEIQSVVSLNAQSNQLKGDIFQGIEYVKLNHIEDKKIDEVKKLNSSINRIWGKVAALDSLSSIWTEGFVTVLFTGLSFGIGALFTILFDNMTVGRLVSIITYGAVFYSNINNIMHTNIDMKKNNSEYEKIFSYLDMSGERESNCGKNEFAMNSFIKLKDFSFGYGDEENILENVNFTFEKGKWTGIVGPSGKGKTTILNTIVKLYPVDNGSIYVDNMDINDIDVFSLRSNITKISQDVFLFPGTIEENMLLVNQGATSKDIDWALEMACLTELIKELPEGIKTDVGEAGKLLSGGERQRLSLAIGLLKKNKILLLDEITANLDSENENKIAENLKGLVDKGYTIISISHKKDFLKYADMVYEL